MLNFTFHNPTTIHFGKGQIEKLEGELKKYAGKVLIVTGGGSVKKTGIFDDVLLQVERSGVHYTELEGIQPNPRLKSVYEGIEMCRREKIDFILPVGGGSVIDAAKAIAAGVPYDGDVWEFFEGEISPEKALPLGTVLTLAATGTEMNPNAVISREDTTRKLHVSSSAIIPVFSILDPVYTFTVNRYHTAAGIADIMAHIFEAYLPPATPAGVQDALAEGLLRICTRFGPVCCSKPDDYNARANILWASTLALNGILGSGKDADWTLHMLEHEVSAIYDISHGAGLAILLPAYMRVAAGKYGPGRFAEYGRTVWGITSDKNEEKIAAEAIDRTAGFFSSIDLPSKLSDIGISDEDFEKIAKNTVRVRVKTDTFEQLSEDDILEVLNLSL